MFFEQIAQIPTIAKNSNFTIFVLGSEKIFQPQDLRLPVTTFTVSPEENSIKTDTVREISELTRTKQDAPLFFLFNQAELLTPNAQNAILKILEEPNHNYHFVFITNQPSLLLPTVLSRSQIFILKSEFNFSKLSTEKEEIKDLAKQLISAQKKDIFSLTKTLTSKKQYQRQFVLEIISLAIEILYKSYLKTKDLRFLTRLNKFINLYHSIEQNGNIRLHLINAFIS